MRAWRPAARRTPRTPRPGCARLPSLPSEPKPPASPRSVSDLRALTPARVGLGRAGAGLPTEALLDFTLDHARARDAVHAAFDAAAIEASLRALGLEAVQVSSRAPDRGDYLRRPHLRRLLGADSPAV